MEAEYHLRAAADAMARGLPEDEAEHEAVSRFGPPALVARKLRSAQGARRLNRALSTGLLLAGLAGFGLGVAYLQDEEQEAQEAPAAGEVVGEQLAWGIGRDSRLADDRYPEAGCGEGIGHRMQWPVPETQ
jgi:hypothetical protein